MQQDVREVGALDNEEARRDAISVDVGLACSNQAGLDAIKLREEASAARRREWSWTRDHRRHAPEAHAFLWIHEQVQAVVTPSDD